MYKYTIIILCLCVSGIVCDLGKEEGADCEWEGLQGKCVKDTRCMTTLETPRHPLCSKNGEDNIICCTDCELVNDTRNALISPTSGVFWKNGQKARDSCVQYIKELPYQCKDDGFYAGISRKLNEDKKCYEYNEWTTESEPAAYFDIEFPLYNYPFQVKLGYGKDPYRRKWSTRGVIVNERYILTAAHARSVDGVAAEFVRLGSFRGHGFKFQNLKRFIPHPEYRPPSFYHDIALVELNKPIEFSANVLPVCLHVDDEVSIKETFSITWTSKLNTQRVDMEQLSEEECKAGVGKPKFLNNGYNHTTQLCYGIKMNTTGLPSDVSEVNSTETCKSFPGAPLMVDTQFSSCVHTAIGLTTFGTRTCGTESRKPSVYLTRISYYLPWIESIVWP